MKSEAEESGLESPSGSCAAGGLRLAGLCVGALGPVELEIAPGELLTLSGPSGCGKSRLLRAVVDLDPHQGEAYLKGCARSEMAAPQWRRRVGLLPAESHWWGEQVGDHLEGIGDEAEGDDGAVIGLLAKLGFERDVLGWSIARLSTGERQRLALVRLLAMAPEALLLDEATANLDPVNADRVEGLVEEYRRQHQTAVLWVSHDVAQHNRLGRRHATICEGRIEVEG